MKTLPIKQLFATAIVLAATSAISLAAPVVNRLTPPSALFTFGDAAPPIISRFLAGQKFDLQATIVPDAGQNLSSVVFNVNGSPVISSATQSVTLTNIVNVSSITITNGGSGYTSAPTVAISGGSTAAATASIDANGVVTSVNVTNAGSGLTGTPTITFSGGGGTGASAVSVTNRTSVSAAFRAYSNTTAGILNFSVTATQGNGTSTTGSGNFEIVASPAAGKKAKNIIIMIGDGMGSSHRTAARIVKSGVMQGKANAPLAMDRYPVTGMVQTASLNSIITDSAPGAACYSTGNKGNNNQQGVFPDDTIDNGDNPRVELIGEFLARTQLKSLGIVTTSDVFDATPGAFGSHTQARGSGTGICDFYLDEAVPKANLTVLMGGGRKWFLPSTTVGTARAAATDYAYPADVVTGWGLSTSGSANDVNRNLLNEFQNPGGFTYAANKADLDGIPANTTKLLGLFAFSNMNVAFDKIDGRRGGVNPLNGQSVVAGFGFPDQPMLNEMTVKALQVLKQNPNGFVLMIEGASIDKQAHNMDSDRWILDTLEFDYAAEEVRNFANNPANGETLAIITADHECAGIAIIGASTKTQSVLASRASAGAGPGNDVNKNGALNPGDTAGLRLDLVGTYEAAGFPQYNIVSDGYPQTMNIDFKMLVGYAANADRYEDWQSNVLPLRDSQQPTASTIYGANVAALPAGAVNQDVTGNFFVTGQVPDAVAAHTGGDIPVSALGRGSKLFTGYMDNTDVFFKTMQAAIGGAAN